MSVEVPSCTVFHRRLPRGILAIVNDALPSSSSNLPTDNPWKLALEGSGAGVWDWNLATGAQSHSAHWGEMLGYPAGTFAQGHRLRQCQCTRNFVNPGFFDFSIDGK